MIEMEFGLELSRFQAALLKNVDLFAKGMVNEIASQIQVGGQYSRGTPVDTGFARANWHASIGEPGSPPIVPPPVTGARGERAAEAEAAAAAVQVAALQVKAGDVLYLSNNAHYIADLELGSSRQAPGGFVRVALYSAQAIADEITNHILLGSR